MTTSILLQFSTNILKGLGNTLFNGFASDITAKDKTYQVGLQLTHFHPASRWSSKNNQIIDKITGDNYCNDTESTIRQKCAALFIASLIVQPVGLLLNAINKICKVAIFAHIWNPSQEKYHFTARLSEWGKDLLVIVSTPLIYVGMLFSALYGATKSPYDGRKLYATLERLAYSGGYQFFSINDTPIHLHEYILAPCFQPSPKNHLGGGQLDIANAW